jgi:hypothetical protein
MSDLLFYTEYMYANIYCQFLVKWKWKYASAVIYSGIKAEDGQALPHYY